MSTADGLDTSTADGYHAWQRRGYRYDDPKKATMFVRLQRLIEDGKVAGWVVDIDDSPLYDTSSRFFSREDAARGFADELAALVIADVRQVEDDVL